MTPQNKTRSPLPRGEGAGGEGSSNAPSLVGRAKKLGHGYAPALGEDRQKDHTRTAIGDYVFDFACYGVRLLIEIDGSIHRLADVQANDKAKEVFAIAQGFRVLRFANNDVWDRPAWVVDQMRAALPQTFSLAEKVAATSPPQLQRRRKRPGERRSDALASAEAERPSPPGRGER